MSQGKIKDLSFISLEAVVKKLTEKEAFQLLQLLISGKKQSRSNDLMFKFS